MPRNYPEPGDRRERAAPPDTHSPGGGQYSFPRSRQGAAGGGQYSAPRSTQGAAGGGSYSVSKNKGGAAGGGDYSFPKSNPGEAVGDRTPRGPYDTGGENRPAGRSRRGKGSIYGPNTARQGGV